MPNFRALLWVTCRPTFHLGLTRISPRSLYYMIWYEGLFEDSSCLMNHCVYAGGWAWNIGENANGSGVDDDVLDEENLGDNPPASIRQVFVFDHHSMHFLTCPFATHQKNEGRKGKQQMTRKIDKTWGLPYKKYWQDMSDFFVLLCFH